MNCKKTQILLPPHIMGDLVANSRQYFELKTHLVSCQACAEEYEEIKKTIEFIEQHKAIFAKALRTLEEKEAAEQEEIECSWKRIQAKLDELETHGREKKLAKFRRLLVRVSSVVACLVIGVFTWLAFSINSKPKIAPNLTPQQIALVPKPSVRIELVSGNGSIIIPANQQITSTDGLKALIINSKHRIVMNVNTTLAVKPRIENSQIGCLVKLDSGRIYTHVQHDGNPFIVDTAHGKAVITGTTFDIKATEDSTTLVVSEGTVQFKSENGVVNVAAGQTSKIVGESIHSIPLLCNTAELTAWATGYKSGPALAQAESNNDVLDLPLSFGKEPIVLGETDYDHWVEQKRDWFKQEFLWIFQLKEALAKEGIEADYPELMIKTGDIWQFACLDISPARFSVIDSNSLLKTASDYGFDKQWLLENVTAVKSALEKPVLSENSFTGLKAFVRWLDYLDETRELEPPTLICSHHATKYLAETRSLIWFAVKNGSYNLTDEERAEVLLFLQEEVTVACKCYNDELYPTDEQKKLSCGDTCQESVDSVVGCIKTMKAVEERRAEYEIGK